MIDLNGTVLFGSLRSPFARRVRLAFREHNIKYEEKMIDVFNLPPEYEKINPLERVPALVLKTGETLVDSNVILRCLYDQYPDSTFIAKGDRERVLSLKWSGIAYGICEALVQYFLETQRPKEIQSEVVLTDSKRIFKNTLESFEDFIEDRPNITGGSLTQSDLDMGAALAYFELRYDSKFAVRYPKAFAYFEKLQARPSFQETKPPA
jgi:glutathione S-transferase